MKGQKRKENDLVYCFKRFLQRVEMKTKKS